MNNLIKVIGMFFFKRLGWKLNPGPNVEKSIILVAGHTSNWDFLIGLAYSKIKGIESKYTIKKEWLRFPFKSFFLKTGALGIQRKYASGEKRIDYISQMDAIFKSHEAIHLVITPEATRSKVKKWKTGFYRLAKKSGVPIVLASIDYKKKEVSCNHLIYAKDTLRETLLEVSEFYKKITPKHPEKFSLHEI